LSAISPLNSKNSVIARIIISADIEPNTKGQPYLGKKLVPKITNHQPVNCPIQTLAASLVATNKTFDGINQSYHWALFFEPITPEFKLAIPSIYQALPLESYIGD
jgi:hypothetical protein